MGNGRIEDQGDKRRVAEEEKSMKMEVCQRNASYSRSTARQVDVSNTIEHNAQTKRGREGVNSPLNDNAEVNARSHASHEHTRSWSNSRDSPGRSRGRTNDIQPRLTFPNPNRHDRVNNNRGTVGTF